MTFKHLALALGAAASLGTAAMLQATTPTTASAAYRVVKTKKYNNQYFFQKTWGKSVYVWNANHSRVLGNLKNAPGVTFHLKKSAVLANGRKRSVYYQIDFPTNKGNRYLWVWRGFLARGGFESSQSLYEKNGKKAPTSYGRMRYEYEQSSSLTNLESYKRFAHVPSKSQITKVVNFLNGPLNKDYSFSKKNYRIIIRPLTFPKNVNYSTAYNKLGYRLPIIVDDQNRFVGTFRAAYDAAKAAEAGNEFTGGLIGKTGYLLPAYSFMTRDISMGQAYPVSGTTLDVVFNGDQFFYVKKNAVLNFSSGSSTVNGVTFNDSAPSNPQKGDTYRALNDDGTGFTSYLYDGTEWQRDFTADFSDLEVDPYDDLGYGYGSSHTGKYKMHLVKYAYSGKETTSKEYTTTNLPYSLAFPSKSYDQNLVKSVTMPDSRFDAYLKLAK